MFMVSNIFKNFNSIYKLELTEMLIQHGQQLNYAAESVILQEGAHNE